ncbi:MAG: energy transducer TonB [Acidobacteria bacterium]|nr:MAG: energy transducer TonB [Acidobacteriota bacterium]
MLHPPRRDRLRPRLATAVFAAACGLLAAAGAARNPPLPPPVSADALPPSESPATRLAVYQRLVALQERPCRSCFRRLVVDLAERETPPDAVDHARRLLGVEPQREDFARLAEAHLSAARQARLAGELERAARQLEAAAHALEQTATVPEGAGTERRPSPLLAALIELERIVVLDDDGAWLRAAGHLEHVIEERRDAAAVAWARRLLQDPSLYLPAAPGGETTWCTGDVRPPVKIFAPPPSYTAAALAARLQGVVILQARIDRNGTVVALRPLKGLPMGLTEEAIRAVASWQFAPATRDGRPVAVHYNLTMNFRLEEAPVFRHPDAD